MSISCLPEHHYSLRGYLDKHDIKYEVELLAINFTNMILLAFHILLYSCMRTEKTDDIAGIIIHILVIIISSDLM